jgi:nicotinamide-nucleotide amidase
MTLLLSRRMQETSMVETLGATIPDDVEHLARDVLKTACEKELMLATAESCTGGLLASLLTDVDGMSHVFERGFVTYSKDAKCELLGLSHAEIDRCGVVSRETAVAMADGALAGSHADVAVSITGYAGPTGGKGEPGLVHFGCARKGRDTVHREEHFGDGGRGAVRIASLRVALQMLKDAIN